MTIVDTDLSSDNFEKFIWIRQDDYVDVIFNTAISNYSDIGRPTTKE